MIIESRENYQPQKCISIILSGNIKNILETCNDFDLFFPQINKKSISYRLF
jgi:hypothetical protein